MRKIHTPLNEDITKKLKAGDSILLSGTIYTARDAAHGRLINLLKEGKELPLNIKGEIIYYVGPTPEKQGEVIGAAGPTTSYRMDGYTPELLDLGLHSDDIATVSLLSGLKWIEPSLPLLYAISGYRAGTGYRNSDKHVKKNFDKNTTQSHFLRHKC